MLYIVAHVHATLLLTLFFHRSYAAVVLLCIIDLFHSAPLLPSTFQHLNSYILLPFFFSFVLTIPYVAQNTFTFSSSTYINWEMETEFMYEHHLQSQYKELVCLGDFASKTQFGVGSLQCTSGLCDTSQQDEVLRSWTPSWQLGTCRVAAKPFSLSPS